MSIFRLLSVFEGDYFAWNLSYASYSGTSFDLSSQETEPVGLFFKSDGTKMYVLGDAGADVNEYDLSSAWDISTASYVQNFSIASQTIQPDGLFFKSDGTKMYLFDDPNADLLEYDLSSAWDVSSASYSQSFSVSGQDGSPFALFFKPDGTKMYVVGTSGDAVYEYDLSSAWDISTASYLQNFSVAAQDTSPTGLFFKPDGSKMYVVGFIGNDVNEYDLSTPWDISTASYLQNFSVASQDTSPFELFFKPDGRVMYVLGFLTDTVYQYNIG